MSEPPTPPSESVAGGPCEGPVLGGAAPKKRRSPSGAPTTDLILSARVGKNAAIFADAASLYLKPGAVVADTTHGKGCFWQAVPPGRYDLRATDLQTGTDARSLPYADGSLDAGVFDPPYMRSNGPESGPYETGAAHEGFRSYYKANLGPYGPPGEGASEKWHAATLRLYYEAAVEMRRCLREEGIYFVKCQDEVCAGRQCLTHVELCGMYTELGFVMEDLFVLVREGRPGVSRQIRQIHARKNHSYLLVARKSPSRRPWTGH